MKKIITTLQKWSQDLRFYFVALSLALIGLMANHMKLKYDYIEVVEDNLYQKATIDSLGSELFVRELESTSYSIMWEILEEVNRPLADSINNLVE